MKILTSKVNGKDFIQMHYIIYLNFENTNTSTALLNSQKTVLGEIYMCSF